MRYEVIQYERLDCGTSIYKTGLMRFFVETIIRNRGHGGRIV